MTTVGIVTGAGSGIGAACAQRLAGTVDVLLLADLTETALGAGEPFVCDITDQAAVLELAARAQAAGTLRSVVHAAGISPTMGDWRRILDVDLVGTARIVDALRPLATAGSAIVCFASMAAHLNARSENAAAEAAIDDPFAEGFYDAYAAALGDTAEDPGTAYSWAKRGVQRVVVREAVTLGPVGARICSISPGMIDTPMGRQEFEQQPMMKMLEDITPRAVKAAPTRSRPPPRSSSPTTPLSLPASISSSTAAQSPPSRAGQVRRGS
jgi:NAD(P)-dependent dehydrogenase (short-subunit alcohol dehydrogenase family)